MGYVHPAEKARRAAAGHGDPQDRLRAMIAREAARLAEHQTRELSQEVRRLRRAMTEAQEQREAAQSTARTLRASLTASRASQTAAVRAQGKAEDALQQARADLARREKEHQAELEELRTQQQTEQTAQAPAEQKTRPARRGTEGERELRARLRKAERDADTCRAAVLAEGHRAMEEQLAAANARIEQLMAARVVTPAGENGTDAVEVFGALDDAQRLRALRRARQSIRVSIDLLTHKNDRSTR